MLEFAWHWVALLLLTAWFGLELIWLYVRYCQLPSSNSVIGSSVEKKEPNWALMGQQFLAFNGLNHYRIVVTEQPVQAFHKLSLNHNIKIAIPAIRSSMLKLDFYLGRLFLACQQITNWSHWNRWRFVLRYAGPWLFYLYWSALVVNLLLLLPFHNQPPTLVHAAFQVSFLTVLTLIKWGFSLHIVAGVICKNDLEHHYELNLRAFFDVYHSDSSVCLRSARQFSHLIKFNFRIGLKWIFDLNPRFRGPFSMI